MTIADLIDRGDSRVYCRRATGEIYAVLSPDRWRELRERRRLNQWLADRRESGEVIREPAP